MSTIEKQHVDSSGKATLAPAYDHSADPMSERGEGWLVFSGFMLGLAGAVGLMAGIVAIADSSFYAANSRFVFSNLNSWGWIVTIVASLTLCAAVGVVIRAQWARWFGIVIAGLQAIAQLLFMQAYPWWSVCVFTIDVLVIYGLSVHGSRTSKQG